MAMMQPTARAMIGVPRKLMKSALTPAMENAEARPIRMMGRTIGANASQPLGSLPNSATSCS